jgi:UDP-glucose 4-epimerase
MSVLVTGGAGYIGSHTLVELIEQDHEVVVIDNLSNSCAESLRRVAQITGVMPRFYLGDVEDKLLLGQIFSNHRIDAVIHFAGLKSVNGSVSQPLHYYRRNIFSTLTLCEQMAKHNCFNLVFSSSAAVYGTKAQAPVLESMPRHPDSPYARTKAIIEHMLEDLQNADPRWSIIRLRYFNPIGAHYSGLIGEDPQGIPCNLLPYITQVAIGHLPKLLVYGNDYSTKDGTGIRDFIHVSDLARAHVLAVPFMTKRPGLHTFNIGTGRGYSVLEMVKAFEKISGKTIPLSIESRREGDIAVSYANTDLARLVLGFEAKGSIEQMLGDAWRWQYQNPQGYGGSIAEPAVLLQKAS